VIEMMHKPRLMVPGPTPLPPEVVAAGTFPMVDERTLEFAEVFTGTLGKLRQVLGTVNDVLLFTSSITGAFESAVANLFSPGERVLVMNNGAFGERWVEMCRAYGLDVVEIKARWGEENDASSAAARLAADPSIRAAICVHCETSTGVVNDIKEFGTATSSVLTIVDSASGLGACELNADEWGLDVVVGGGQKALMTPPGLSFVSVSERAWQRHATATLPRYYFDWSATRDALHASIPRTPWTPAVGLIVQLDTALTRLLAEGVPEVLDRHMTLGRVARAGLRGMQLELVASPRDRNACVTAAYVPDGIDGEDLVRQLAIRHGVQIAGGSGPLADQVIRIGHCGYLDSLDVITAIAALELTLRTMGHPLQLGAGTASAIQVLSHDCPYPAHDGRLIAMTANRTVTGQQ
jgi:aspartate aminotransferase-like enzyme